MGHSREEVSPLLSEAVAKSPGTTEWSLAMLGTMSAVGVLMCVLGGAQSLEAGWTLGIVQMLQTRLLVKRARDKTQGVRVTFKTLNQSQGAGPDGSGSTSGDTPWIPQVNTYVWRAPQ